LTATNVAEMTSLEPYRGQPGLRTHATIRLMENTVASTEENKQIARDYMKAFMQGDEAWLRRHIAPEFRRNDPGRPFEVRGPEGVKQLVDGFLSGIPDIELFIEDVIAEGEKVLVRLRAKGTHSGDLIGVPPTGRPIDIDVLDLLQFRDGVLVEQWALIDNLGLLRQIGGTQI
jgi:predicted ester cyclase